MVSSGPHLRWLAASLTTCLLLPREPPDSHTPCKPVRRILCFWSDLGQRLESWLAASWLLKGTPKLREGRCWTRLLRPLGFKLPAEEKAPWGNLREYFSSHSPENLACSTTPSDGGTKRRGYLLGKGLNFVVPTAMIGACGVFQQPVKSLPPPC